MINATQQPPGNIVINLKLKFQGIIGRPTAGDQMNVRVKLGGGSLSQPTDYQTATFTVGDGGIWSGQVSFNVPAGGGYRVYVKGPKHLQKKVCVATPSEESPGVYRCADGAITLADGENDLNFSGIYQLVGDLPEQNGFVDAYDISLVRNNLGSTDATVLSQADLNLDGVINVQDHSLIISSLEVKYDEE